MLHEMQRVVLVLSMGVARMGDVRSAIAEGAGESGPRENEHLRERTDI